MRWLRHNLILSIIGLLLAQTLLAEEPLQLMPAGVLVNYVDQGVAFLLWNGADDFYVSESDLSSWRVRPPYGKSVEYRGKEYFSVMSIPGASADIDRQKMQVDVQFPPEIMKPQLRSIKTVETPEPDSAIGLSLDYDISYIDDTVDSYPFAWVAPTFFSRAGVLTSQFVYQDIDFPEDRVDENDDFLRLETTFTRDDPDHLRSYRGGDVISAQGPWGSSLRLGGLQIATNFATQPSLVTFPVPYLEGMAATPSTVDLFVDGMLRYRTDVESGFYRIDDVPTITGQGELTMVVRDVTGRATTITRDFYASTQLLQKGLADYSYSAGFLREDYGLKSNEYDDFAFIGEHRLGLEDDLTLGGRLEASEDVQLFGGKADWALGRGGILSAGAAVSNEDEDGVGGGLLLGYEWLGEDYRFRTQATGNSEDFAAVDAYESRVLEKYQLAMSAGLNRGITGSLSASLIYQDYWEGLEDRTVFTVTYTTRYREFFISSYANYINSDESDYLLGISVSYNFGERSSAGISLTHNDDDTRFRSELQQQTPVGPGFGYRFGATLADNTEDVVDGSLVGQSEFGRYSVDARSVDGDVSWQAGTQGSLTWLDGNIYAARETMDGFAVTQVADVPNVRVYLENQEIGRTDSEGRILLPSLRPYESNRVSVAVEDLPLGARLDTLEVNVAPYFRSGMLVDFPVVVSRQAIFRAMLENDQPVPEGSIVRVDAKAVSVVGTDGLVYLEGLEGSTPVTLLWKGQSCELNIPLPEGDEPLPDLGQLVCKESK